MSESSWMSSITQIKPNEVRLRGYRIDELMGQVSFGQAVYLTLVGELPSQEVGRLIEAILVCSIDHGASPPSALAARTAASTGAPLNAAIAAGVLSINRHHGGAVEDCMALLQDAIRRAGADLDDFDQAAQELVAEYQAAGRRLAGLGHRIHSRDPRTEKLFTLAEQANVAREGVRMIRALQSALEASGKQLPINVDGAIAAVLVDLGIAHQVANGFFIMARVPGLVAHVNEEQTRERPMRRIHPADHGYDGPQPRSISE